MGASLALAGVTACTRQPKEEIAPYVRQPEQIVPGKSLFFATAMTVNGVALGLLAESHEGRPTKIEGNKDHPSSLGATDVFAQASVLGLYDPDRSQSLMHLGDIVTWSSFLGAIRPLIDAQRAAGTQPAGTQPAGTQPAGTQPAGTQPAGAQPAGTQPGAPASASGTLRILTETVTSPT